MVGKVDYSSVPASADLENNSNQKKYTVNQTNKKGLVISKPLCALMAIGAFLLALLVGLIVFFLVPRYCNAEKPPEALTHTHKSHTGLSNSADTNKADDGLETKADDGVDERLPRSIAPEHYKIRILPDLQNFTTKGTVTMILEALENTNEIIFHLRDIEILDDSVSVKSTKSESSPLKISNQEYLPGDKYKISLKDSLQTKEQYELNLEFTGMLNGHLQGFYRGSYIDAKGEKRVIATTQFSPTEARRAFPCFDEPSFKAKFEIILGRPSHMSTLSNMPLLKSTPFTKTTGRLKRSSKSMKNKRDNKNDNAISDLWYWDEYPETPKMSTYLVAFMVHDFKNKSSPDPLIKCWAREEAVSQTTYATEIVPKILHYFENYFDINFPLKKIDLVAVPDFGFNAMENWGLITFRETSLLYDPMTTTTDEKRSLATTISHELAHQWFGNLVTPKFWNDLWLKEGFANYMQYLGLNHAEPTWKVMEEFIISECATAMNADAFENSRKLSFDEVKNTPQIRQLFDSISYSKGACILRMMNNFLGEKTFKDGLIRFLKKYQYSNADRNNLFEVLTEEAQKNGVLKPDESVNTIMNSWTDKAGYPVVHAVANYEQQKLTISQKRFYFKETDEKSSWWVPISFITNATNNSPNFTDTLPKFWLKGEYEIEEKVNLTVNDWYLLNIEQTGYFTVNYDDRNWEKLTENIMNFPPAIRAQLIANSMDLARANLLDYDIPLTLIANMAIQDVNIMFIPTSVAFTKLNFLKNILIDTPAFGLFEEYHRNIFQDTYKKVMLEDTIDDYITRKIRTIVLDWSCSNPDSRCTHMAKTSFREWITRGKMIEPNLRSIVYCTAIREGGEIEWNFAYRKYLETSSAAEKETIINALGCTRLSWVLSRYLEQILLPSIRIQDAGRLFGHVVRNRVGTQIAFDFIRQKWNEINAYHGTGFNIVSRMVKSLGPHLNTKFQLSELIRFRDEIKSNLTSAAMAFEEAIETVKQNVEWREKMAPKVEQWFQNNRDIRSRIIEKQRIERYLQNLNSARGA